MSESKFLHSFRMKREQFEKLLLFIKENFCIADLKLKLYLYLYFIGHVVSFRRIEDTFGIKKSTANVYINEMIEKINLIAHKKILFPNFNEMEELANGFFNIAPCRNTILALDGTHFYITKPTNDPFNFYNRKMCFSLNFLCVVDFKKRFGGVTYGFGKSHDSSIYNDSNLKNLIDQISHNYFVVTDPVFINFRNIFSTYNNTEVSPEILKNAKLQRLVVEHVFGMLKNKFKKISVRSLVINDEIFIKMIKGVMFIHNFLIDN